MDSMKPEVETTEAPAVTEKPAPAAQPASVTPYIFEGLCAWVGGFKGEYECSFWADNPKDRDFDQRQLIPIRLDKTVNQAKEGVIYWNEVLTTDFVRPDLALPSLGKTTVGPRFCESGASYNGGICIESEWLAMLRLSYDIPPMTDYWDEVGTTNKVARRYEFFTVYMVDEDKPDQPTCYHGFHCKWNGTAISPFGEIFQRGRSHLKDENKLFTLYEKDLAVGLFDVGFQESIANVLPRITLIDPKVAQTQEGAIFIREDFAMKAKHDGDRPPNPIPLDAEKPAASGAGVSRDGGNGGSGPVPPAAGKPGANSEGVSRDGGSGGSDPKRPPAFFQDLHTEGSRRPVDPDREKWAKESLALRYLNVCGASWDAVNMDLWYRLYYPLQIANRKDLEDLLAALLKAVTSGEIPKGDKVALDLIGHTSAQEFYVHLGDWTLNDPDASDFFRANKQTLLGLGVNRVRLLGCWTYCNRKGQDLIDGLNTVLGPEIVVVGTIASVGPDQFDEEGFMEIETYRLSTPGEAPPTTTP